VWTRWTTRACCSSGSRGLDLGKAELTACVRVPHPDRPGRRCQEVWGCSALTPALLGLADWLRCERVRVVSMEATGDYWKPVYYFASGCHRHLRESRCRAAAGILVTMATGTGKSIRSGNRLATAATRG
jgi:hypothetical protein